MNIDIQNCKFVAQEMAQLLQIKFEKMLHFFQYPPILVQHINFYRHGYVPPPPQNNQMSSTLHPI